MNGGRRPGCYQHQYSDAVRLRVLEDAAVLRERGQGQEELLRRHGLQTYHLSNWRQQIYRGSLIPNQLEHPRMFKLAESTRKKAAAPQVIVRQPAVVGSGFRGWVALDGTIRERSKKERVTQMPKTNTTKLNSAADRLRARRAAQGAASAHIPNTPTHNQGKPSVREVGVSSQGRGSSDSLSALEQVIRKARETEAERDNLLVLLEEVYGHISSMKDRLAQFLEPEATSSGEDAKEQTSNLAASRRGVSPKRR